MSRVASVAVRTAAVLAGGAVAVHALPAVRFQPALRGRVLSGVGDPGHVALTFDDGPHPRSTPFFLDALDRFGVRATFFLLGAELARCPRLGAEIVAAGHEVAVHGWQHRTLLRYGPGRTYDELARARDLIADATGRTPRWFRPPYGVLTTPALRAARRLDLTPVLWSCWGWDWSARSTPESVARTVRQRLAGGGTILLHDSDTAAFPGAWRSTLGALPEVLRTCADHGWTVGPLREHGLESVLG